jgi:hypothetical protein
MERNRLWVTVIVVKVLTKFIKRNLAAKLTGQRNNPKRMRRSIVNNLSIFGDFRLNDVPL